MKNVVDNLYVLLKNDNTKMPIRSTEGSAGYDIFAHRKMVIPAKTIVSIKLPFTFEGELDEGLEVRLFVRSSFGIKKKLRLVHKNEMNIEYLVLDLNDKNHIINVFNDSDNDLIIREGEHFAQFVICEKHRKNEKMMIETVPEEELQKHKILKGMVQEVEPNVFDYVLEEDIVLLPKEQRMFATGLRVLINEGTWTAITTHKDIRDKVMLANQTAVIDKDYAFADNYGHCFIALVNLLDKEINIKRGTKLLSLWTEKYYVLKNEEKSNKKRSGGIGSTSKTL